MMSRSLALALSLALLLSTIGLVAHDHGAALESGSYDCVVDHHTDEVGPTSASTEVQQAGKRHLHQCVGCYFSNYRPFLASYREIEAGLDVSGERILRPSSAPRVFASHRDSSLRGPPRA